MMNLKIPFITNYKLREEEKKKEEIDKKYEEAKLEHEAKERREKLRTIIRENIDINNTNYHNSIEKKLKDLIISLVTLPAMKKNLVHNKRKTKSIRKQNYGNTTVYYFDSCYFITPGPAIARIEYGAVFDAHNYGEDDYSVHGLHDPYDEYQYSWNDDNYISSYTGFIYLLKLVVKGINGEELINESKKIKEQLYSYNNDKLAQDEARTKIDHFIVKAENTMRNYISIIQQFYEVNQVES